MLTITYDRYGTQIDGPVNMWQCFTVEEMSELQYLGFTYYPDGIICEGKARDYWQAGYTVDPAQIESATGFTVEVR